MAHNLLYWDKRHQSQGSGPPVASSALLRPQAARHNEGFTVHPSRSSTTVALILEINARGLRSILLRYSDKPPTYPASTLPLARQEAAQYPPLEAIVLAGVLAPVSRMRYRL